MVMYSTYRSLATNVPGLNGVITDCVPTAVGGYQLKGFSMGTGALAFLDF